MDKTPDYLAVVLNAYGGGSYARGKDRAATIKRAAQIYKGDWKHLFPGIGKKGSALKVNVVDCTGFDLDVEFGASGFYEVTKEGKRSPLSREVKVETFTY